MTKFWQKKSHQSINEEVNLALQLNRSYFNERVIGMPGSHLDSKVFPKIDDLFVDAPFLRTLVNNPNHIGCHTLTEAEPTFAGTHHIERELLNIIACDIFKADENAFDGYVASGGTEANLQAIWFYREYFKRTKKIPSDKFAVFLFCF
ncbi:MAG: aspartate aminotransferase family protein, partial [Spirosomaceae bacterium]|nr:aspartate aminotransferase family protein [Spirosomataceae bacterium]